MSKRIVPVILAAVLGAIVSIGLPLQAEAAGKSCPSSYTSNCRTCTRVPTTGSFTIHVATKSTSLKGKGSKKTSGTRICVTVVAKPSSRLGGFGLRVRATGSFQPLHASSGSIYKFNPSTNKTTKIGAITSNGIYQLTPH